MTYCAANIAWTGAFVSRNKELVGSSDNIDFVVSKLNSEDTCAKIMRNCTIMS